MKTLKEKMRACELVCGMHITLADPSITELCGRMGYDYLWIDTEHSPMDYQTVLHHLIAASSAGCDAIVRIPWNDAVMAKRVLEMGPAGIIFPMVCSAAELDRAMKSTLYPPLGNRGFGPQRAVGYGLEDAAAYVKEKSLEMVRIVQIETQDTVDNQLDEMLENPWVDCFMLGPCDLSASIGRLPDTACKESLALQDRAIRKIRAAGKSAGTSIVTEDPEVIRSWWNRGVNVITCGTEVSAIISGCLRTLSMLRSVNGSGPRAVPQPGAAV